MALKRVKYLFNRIKNQHCNYRPILFTKDKCMLFLSLSQKNLNEKRSTIFKKKTLKICENPIMLQNTMLKLCCFLNIRFALYIDKWHYFCFVFRYFTLCTCVTMEVDNGQKQKNDCKDDAHVKFVEKC